MIDFNWQQVDLDFDLFNSMRNYQEKLRIKNLIEAINLYLTKYGYVVVELKEEE